MIDDDRASIIYSSWFIIYFLSVFFWSKVAQLTRTFQLSLSYRGFFGKLWEPTVLWNVNIGRNCKINRKIIVWSFRIFHAHGKLFARLRDLFIYRARMMDCLFLLLRNLSFKLRWFGRKFIRMFERNRIFEKKNLAKIFLWRFCWKKLTFPNITIEIYDHGLNLSLIYNIKSIIFDIMIKKR